MSLLELDFNSDLWKTAQELFLIREVPNTVSESLPASSTLPRPQPNVEHLESLGVLLIFK